MKLNQICFLSAILLSGALYAQNDCTTAESISAIPFNETGLTTLNKVDDYGPADACGSDAMENEDYVFSYTPTSDISINIKLSNTEVISDSPMSLGAAIGLFVVDGVPTDSATNCIAIRDDLNENPEISNVNLTSGTTYYFIISSADESLIVQTYATYVNFDISVEEVIAHDAGITDIVNITSDCELTDVEITCTIHNFGVNEITSTDLAFLVDEGSAITETYTGSIMPNEETTYTFTTMADISVVGTHNIVVYTLLTDDENALNDKDSTSVINTPTIITLPYSESFESDEHYWSGSENSSWNYGVPADSITINNAYDGLQIFATNINGNYNTNEISQLNSPCFDFTTSNGIKLSMAVWQEPGLLGATMQPEYSTDAGANWIIIDDTWSGSTGGWVLKEYVIPEIAGASNVRFRISFEGGYIADEGLAIDMIKIEELPTNEIAVNNILSPISSCILSNSETISANIVNNGVFSQTGFNISYSIDNGNTWASETYTSNIAASTEELYTFSTTADFSTIGDYTVIVAVDLTDDSNTSNDTISTLIYHGDILSDFPYSESFEDNDGDWNPSGTNTSLEHGTPSGTIIDTASDGSQAWVTNLSGVINSNEISYLTSPCFDFLNLTNPIIDVDIFYSTQIYTSGIIMEYSIDNGMYWDTIQSGSAATNWYTSGALTGSSWNGNSETWITAHNNLSELAGEENVMLRFSFNSGNYSVGSYEGIGIDNIRILDCTDIPNADFSYSITNENEVSFTNNSTNADSVEWNFGDNTLFPTTSNEENPVFTYNTEGIYTVSLSVFNACGSSETTQDIEIYITEIGSNNEALFEIFPNPVSEMLNISGNNISKISIYSIDGKCIYSSKNSDDIIKISTQNMDSGLYLLKVQTSKGIQTRNFIKK